MHRGPKADPAMARPSRRMGIHIASILHSHRFLGKSPAPRFRRRTVLWPGTPGDVTRPPRHDALVVSR